MKLLTQQVPNTNILSKQMMTLCAKVVVYSISLSTMMAMLYKLFISETCKVVTLMSNVCSGGEERTSKEREAQQTSGNKTGQHRQSQTQIKTQV